MRLLLAAFLLIFVTPALAQRKDQPSQLCDAARKPSELQSVQGRGVIVVDEQRNAVFLDVSGCELPVSMPVLTLFGLRDTQVTMRGRLHWTDEPPALNRPNGHWRVDVERISDLVLLPARLGSLAGAPIPPVEVLPHLCDVGRAPSDGQAAQARGTLFFDQHGSWFVEKDRRCGIRASAQPDTLADIWMFALYPVAPSRVEATVQGRIAWSDQRPAMGLPPGFWFFQLSSISEIVITSRTADQAIAELRAPKQFLIGSPR